MYLQRVLETMSTGHVRVSVVGNVDAGKSTLIGTLTSSTLDNGKGSNRAKIMKHKHEAETGRTSSITSHLMGFDENGDVITSRQGDADIARKAQRVVSLMDLAGHEKYFKTTIAGLSRGMADYALVLVNAAQPPTHMTMHHLGLCTACGIPVVVVITKVDACPGQVLRNTKQLTHDKLRSPEVGKRPYSVRSERDIETVKDKMHTLVPVIEASCVTGEGLDLIRKLLVALPKRRQHHKKIERPFELTVDDYFNVTGIGIIVSGFVNAGEWRKGDALYIGPLKDGTYVKTAVKTVHVARTEVDRVWAGHDACFALSLTKSQRKMLSPCKGVVALKIPVPPSKSFSAEIFLMKGVPVTMINGRYQTMVHILHLKRTVQLTSIETFDPGSIYSGSEVVLRPGCRARVTFTFVQGPAYVRKGMRIILREGHVRGIGVVL
jgi:elongation factor 1-alpha